MMMTIPDTVSFIGGAAFTQCDELISLNIPDLVVTKFLAGDFGEFSDLVDVEAFEDTDEIYEYISW